MHRKVYRRHILSLRTLHFLSAISTIILIMGGITIRDGVELNEKV